MTKYCPKCKETKSCDEFHYRETEKRYHQWCKNCTYTYQKDRWKIRKYQAVDLMGGKCTSCGYNKNYAALEFHHLDPKVKEFAWNKLRQTSWATIIEELKKCTLLCANCHREVHNPNPLLHDIPDTTSIFNQNQLPKPTGFCPNCNTETFGTKYCSTICAKYAKRKVERPNKEQLQELIKTKSYVEIGKQFAVSDTTIRKWKKFYGIE